MTSSLSVLLRNHILSSTIGHRRGVCPKSGSAEAPSSISIPLSLRIALPWRRKMRPAVVFRQPTSFAKLGTISLITCRECDEWNAWSVNAGSAQDVSACGIRSMPTLLSNSLRIRARLEAFLFPLIPKALTGGSVTSSLDGLKSSIFETKDLDETMWPEVVCPHFDLNGD